MAKAVRRPAESWTYVLLDDQRLPVDEQSVWTLRPMTHTERAAAQDDLVRQFIAEGGTFVLSRAKQQGYAIALRHIIAVRNFPAGAAQPWPADHAARVAFLEQLDDEYVREIADEVFNKSTLMGEDGTQLKNSSPPELTSRSGGSEAAPTFTAATDAPGIPS